MLGSNEKTGDERNGGDGHSVECIAEPDFGLLLVYSQSFAFDNSWI